MCPIFASSASNCLTRYDQILSGCSLGCKNALNFTCLPMKFHNCFHTNVHLAMFYQWVKWARLLLGIEHAGQILTDSAKMISCWAYAKFPIFRINEALNGSFFTSYFKNLTMATSFSDFSIDAILGLKSQPTRIQPKTHISCSRCLSSPDSLSESKLSFFDRPFRGRGTGWAGWAFAHPNFWETSAKSLTRPRILGNKACFWLYKNRWWGSPN